MDVVVVKPLSLHVPSLFDIHYISHVLYDHTCLLKAGDFPMLPIHPKDLTSPTQFNKRDRGLNSYHTILGQNRLVP